MQIKNAISFICVFAYIKKAKFSIKVFESNRENKRVRETTENSLFISNCREECHFTFFSVMVIIIIISKNFLILLAQYQNKSETNRVNVHLIAKSFIFASVP